MVSNQYVTPDIRNSLGINYPAGGLGQIMFLL